MSEKIVAGNLDEVISRGDHGDRSGGLLSGYVGLITVPVAYNCYEKAPEAAKAAMASFLTQLCHSLKRPQTMWSFLHIRSI